MGFLRSIVFFSRPRCDQCRLRLLTLPITFLALFLVRSTSAAVTDSGHVQLPSYSKTDAQQDLPTSVSFPLYGSIHRTAYWFADIFIGSPVPQRQSLIVDTGSSVTAFPCSDCKQQCGKHVDAPFNLSISDTRDPVACDATCPLCSRSFPPIRSTHNDDSLHDAGNTNQVHPQAAQCAYRVEYTEGSLLAGRWYQDQLWVHQRLPQLNGTVDQITTNTSARLPIPFGCHARETHLFLKQKASGILGLEPESGYGPQPFVTSVLRSMLSKQLQPKESSSAFADLSAMKNQRLTDAFKQLNDVDAPDPGSTKPAFAMCLSESGGVLTVGGYNTELHRNVESSMLVDGPRLSRTSFPWRSQYATVPYIGRRNRGLEDPTLTHQSASPFNNRVRQLSMVLTVGELPETAVPLFSENQTNSFRRTDNEVHLRFGELDGDESTRKNREIDPAPNGLTDRSSSNTSNKALLLTVSRPGNDATPKTYFSGITKDMVNATDVLSINCFGNETPLRAFRAPLPEKEGSTGRHEQLRLFIAPTVEARSNVIRCLQNYRVPRSRRREVGTSHRLPNTLPVMSRFPSQRSRHENFNINTIPQNPILPQFYHVANVASQYPSTTPKLVSQQPYFNSTAIGEQPGPWVTHNVPKEDIFSWEHQIDLLEDGTDTDLLQPKEARDMHVEPAVVGHYLPSAGPGIKWTPFMTFERTAFGVTDFRQHSYYVFLNDWSVKGIPDYASHSVVLPKVPSPTEHGRYSDHTLTTSRGLLALVDSGTTLTYLPLLVYASVWTSMLEHVATARQVLNPEQAPSGGSNRRGLAEKGSYSPSVRRVHGVSFHAMEDRVKTYIGTLERRLQRFNATSSVKSSLVRAMSSRVAGWFGAQRRRMNTVSGNEETGALQLSSRLQEARDVLARMLRVRTSIERQLLSGHGKVVGTPDHADSEKSSGAPVRNLFEATREVAATQSQQNDEKPSSVSIERQSTLPSLDKLIATTDLGSLLEPHSMPGWIEVIKQESPLTRDRRLLYPLSVGEIKEECWLLTRGDKDLVYFAEMELRFLRDAPFIWRPKAFLYKKGNTNIYCSTLLIKPRDNETMIDEEADDELSTLYATASNQPPRANEARWSLTRFLSTLFDSMALSSLSPSLKRSTGTQIPAKTSIDTSHQKRLLETNDESAVLGSSFFLYHDLIFHLEAWYLGMVEAECPTTNLDQRLSGEDINKTQVTT